MTLGLLLSRTADTYTGGSKVLCDCTDPICFSNYLLWGRAGTQGQQRQTLRASAPATEESTLLPTGCTATATEQSSKPCSTTCTDSGHCNTSHTPITGIMASIPLENIHRCPQQKQSSHQEHWTQSTQECPHIKTPLQDYIDSYFSWIHKDRESWVKWKAEELIPVKRARGISARIMKQSSPVY